jgi:hypothetical protein
VGVVEVALGDEELRVLSDKVVLVVLVVLIHTRYSEHLIFQVQYL